MKRISVILGLSVCLAMIALPAVGQDKLQASEFQVTFDSGGHSTPMIGRDSMGDLIVYSQYPIVNGMPGNAGIYYQRVASGAPFGPAVTVADSPANQWLNDVSGDNIVYTLSPGLNQLGNIILYQISTAQARALTSAGNAWEPRIYGDYVVWVEVNSIGAGQAVLYQISSGTPVQTTVMAGPSPSVVEVSIGDRFIVWSQLVNGLCQLAAYDMQRGLSVTVASDAQADLRVPSTRGPWIAYQSMKTNGTASDIDLINMDTGEKRAIASNGFYNLRPHISGDLISYESNVLVNRQIFIYRIAEGDTFQVTSSTYDEHLNDIYGDLVTYIDSRNGNDGVFASSISFFSSPSQPITTSPSPAKFANVNLGSSSTQDVTLNIKTGLTISNIAAGGEYSVGTNSCETTFSTPATCTVPVSFAPINPGMRSSPLLVTDGNNHTYSFALEGTGTGSAIAFTPGIINTIAGNGTPCLDSTTACGDGGTATSAQLNYPVHVAVDSAGNLFIADEMNNRVRKVDSSGTITTAAGNGTPCFDSTAACGDGNAATAAQLQHPAAVALDSAGNLYIADYLNARVRKVDANGIITTVAGTGTFGFNGDNVPAITAQLNYPSDVVVDSAGNLYISDNANNRVRKVDINGIITTVAGNGTQGYSGDGGSATNAQLWEPYRLAVDASGNLYLLDYGNDRIRKVDTNGNISTIAGTGTEGYSGDGSQATGAEFNFPQDLALDAAGDLFIVDEQNQVIRKVDTNGIVSTIAGNGGRGYAGDTGLANSAEFLYPNGIAVDGSGNLYIADTENNRIRKVDVTTSLMSFGPLQLGQTSASQTVQLSNVGNATLTFAQTDAFSVSTNFQLLSTANNECATGSSLTPGASCSLQAAFAPIVPNSLTGTLSVSDHPQKVNLSGTGIAPPPVFNFPAPGSTLAIAEATAPGGAQVAFSNPSATTWNGSVATVTCRPASGSQFGLGQTAVNCRATDPGTPSLHTITTFYVVVRDTTAPVLVLPANIVTDAIAPSGAPVTYTVTATDLVDPQPAVSCSQPSCTIFAIGTTTVTCTSTDFSGNTSSGSFSVLVKAAAQQVTDLVALTNTYNLKQGIQNSLDIKLQNAEAALVAANAGIPVNVCNLIGAFINETTAQSGKALTVDQASQLIANATRIKTVLACQ